MVATADQVRDLQLDRIEAKLDEMLAFKAELEKVVAVFASGGGLKMAAALVRGKT